MKQIFKTGNVLHIVRQYMNQEISISYLCQLLNEIVDKDNKQQENDIKRI